MNKISKFIQKGFLYDTLNKIIDAVNYLIELAADPVGFEIIIVEQLPTKGEKGKFYFVLNEGTEHDNYYDEYVWLNNQWEKMGTTKINLTEIYNRINEVKQLAYAGL